jgi:hypothetical protein
MIALHFAASVCTVADSSRIERSVYKLRHGHPRASFPQLESFGRRERMRELILPATPRPVNIKSMVVVKRGLQLDFGSFLKPTVGCDFLAAHA